MQMPCNGTTMTLPQFQSYGYDLGSVQKPAPPLSELLVMSRKQLGLLTEATRSVYSA